MRLLDTTARSIAAQRWRWLGMAVGFTVLYYALLLAFTMLRFWEIPNYVVFHDTLHVYSLIFSGTPSWLDALPILMAEPWFEAGYKNPDYYGVATWSYMLIPPKMLLVLLMGMCLATFFVLKRQGACRATLHSDSKSTAAAGLGTTFISLTSATLTWVVCCSTPSWSVALAMLGMSASLALWLEPVGNILMFAGLALLGVAIYFQARRVIENAQMQITIAN